MSHRRRILLALLAGAIGTIVAVPHFLGLRARALLTHLRPPRGYVVPVEGVAAGSLVSTFGAPRPGGRHHEGADIFARRDTPVVASVAGTVVKVGLDHLGGRVVTVLGDGPAFYYYAHLDHWAPAIARGDEVHPGEVLGFVGNTGDARTTPCHLHFGVYRVGWRGVHAVDPVPLLRHARMVPLARPRRLRGHESLLRPLRGPPPLELLTERACGVE